MAPSGAIQLEGSTVAAGLSGATLREPIAFAVHLEGVDMMGQSIQESTGEALGPEGFSKGRLPVIRVAPRSWRCDTRLPAPGLRGPDDGQPE